MTRAEIAQLIVEQVRVCRWPPELLPLRSAIAAGLLANAWAESKLDPNAVGDGGSSIGLFQCHRHRGLGRGWSISQLKDPITNTRIIIHEIIRLKRLFSDARTVGDISALITIHIERPKDMHTQAQARRRFLRIFRVDPSTPATGLRIPGLAP